MKKIFASLFLLIVMSIFSFGAFAENTKFFGGDFGFSTGIPVYGGNTDSPYKNRVIVGLTGDISLNLGNPLKFLFGYDFLSDINWDGSQHKNHLDYAGWFGIKVYPGFGGLNASLAYALGARTDFISERYIDSEGTEKKHSEVETSAWGNGFRLGAEYDFHQGSKYRMLPALGFYYRMMPRGSNNYDNIFAFYVNMAF